MSNFTKEFREELVKRFHLDKLKDESCWKNSALADIGRRYVETFMADPEVRATNPNAESLYAQTAQHCYHAGLCVALYYLTEEDYEPNEKTFAVLTNMDTVFFAGLMFTRWNVKKRCVQYKTDFMSESIYRVLKAKIAEAGGDITDFPEVAEAMALIFLAGVVTDVSKLEDPYADLSGLD